MLWGAFALMTVVAAAAVLFPFLRKPRLVEKDNDAAVYRDQIDEVGRDLALGLIGEAEAQVARTELSRRLLSVTDTKPAPQKAATGLRWALAIVALLALPAGASSLYLALGFPSLPGQPIEERVADVHKGQSITELVARVEAYLERNPEDGRGWEVLAPVYFRLGRMEDAVNARRRALAFAGETAERQADLGEATAALANGRITPEAKAAFERALALDAGEVKARYYMGLAAEQGGRPQDAAAIWRDMLAAAPARANWIETVKSALARVGGEPPAATPGRAASSPAPAGAAPAPNEASPASPLQGLASAQGEPSQAQGGPAQDDMVKGMVARLAARLKSGGGSPEDWARLVRSYNVIKDEAKAREATAEGEAAFANDPEKLAQLRGLLKEVAQER